MPKHRAKKLFFASLSAAFLSLVSFSYAHAQLGAEVGAQAGLGGGDIRVIIGRIIQVALGLLGLVALVLIIYSGFLWMTAGGDEEKIANAKRVMTQAIIGLAIILSAFAIASFVINSLVSATGGAGAGGAGGGGGGGGGGLSTASFTVSAINPPGSKAADFKFPKNSQVAIVFKNGSPDPTTATRSTISVNVGTTTGAFVQGTVKVDGNTAIFSSTTPCEENADYFCFPADSTLVVSVSSSITSLTGRALTCGLCSATFQTGNYIDTQPPTISISTPADGQSVPVNSFVSIFSDAKDDSAVASVDYSADAKDLETVGVEPWEYDWDTTGKTPGTTVALGAQATDIVGNTASAAPVHVTLRPIHCFNKVKDADETGIDCGASCGACPGATCVKDADCNSGICENNICVDKPRIDSFAPAAGGPGTLVTIKGAGFGSAPGHVVFLGTSASGDEKSAPPCAPAAWTNNEVIVAVPDGAVSGPLELDTASNGSDRTDDSFGNNSVPNFSVTSDVLPGICTLTPAGGAPGTSVDINGTGFGDNQGTSEADFAGRPAAVVSWAGGKVTATAPNLLAGIWPVSIKIGGKTSNGVSFTVPEAGGVPHILSIDPTSGPVGEYITITGANFGDTPGKVQFTLSPDTYLGGTDFPAACGSAFWHDSSITVKAPTGGTIGDYTVRVVSVSGIQSDNTVNFTLGGGTPKPGLCRVDPAAGPPNSKFTLYGERLGATTGTVTFSKNKTVTAFSSWNDGQVMGGVQPSAATGPVVAAEAGGQVSNSVLFTVGNCKTDKICSGSDTCCDDGTCRAPKPDGSSACAPEHHDGAYAYRFSTGVIPLVPHVIEDPACDKYTQSPSPYVSSADACVNAVLSARFDVGMNNATLVPANFNVYPCGADDKFDKTKCSAAPLKGKVVAFGASQPVESGMNFVSDDNLTPNTWYLATVSKNVASVAGVNMDEDYTWVFRARDSSDPCALSGINVCPADNVLSDIWKPTDAEKQENVTYSNYVASPHAENCNAVKCGAYGWSWNTDTPNSVDVIGDTSGGDSACLAVARALSETPAKSPAKVNAVATVAGNAGKVLATGTGNLTVKFVDPKVDSYWPNCDKACLEAEVGAKFNTAMDAATVVKNNVKLFRCADETCTTTTDLGAGVNYTDSDVHTLAFTGVTLAANAYYLARISNNVQSSAHVALTGANSVWNGTPVFSWSFRVGADHCKVAAVGMTPPQITTNVVGEYDSLTAVPLTAPDACATGGERIDSFQIKDWTWKIDPTPPGGAELYKTGGINVRPVNSVYVTSSCLNAGTEPARPVCGNGIVEDGYGKPKSYASVKDGGLGGEECDLGKSNDPSGTATDGSTGSGCSASCLLTGARTKVCATAGGAGCCGDSVVQGICQDDPNNFVPSDSPVVCTADKDCGTGVCRFDVPGAEQCDQGANNGKPGSGCSAKCLSLGSLSLTPPTTCGNNDVAYNEQCDDGNNASGDGCSAECLDEGSTSGISVCGNSMIEAGEDCDAGAKNGQPGSGCTKDCKNAGTWTCKSSTDTGCCGDNKLEAGEDAGCDLGWDASAGQPKIAEGCDLSCRKLGSSFNYSTPSVCADNLVGLGETVDPGSSDTFVDPTQFSHTVGVGNPDPTDKSFTSTVTATTGGVSGTGTVKLQCGYTDDSQCTPKGQRFVGYNTCCYAPPRVTGTYPIDGQTNVCRNPLIEISFDTAGLIDEKTVPGSVEVSKNSDCHAPVTIETGTGWKGLVQRVVAFFGEVWDLVFGRPAEAQNVNNANANVPANGTTTDPCLVPGTVTVVTEKTDAFVPYSDIQFIPAVALDPNSSYTIKILGIDGSGAHIRSANGVALQLTGAGTDYAVFKTGADICTLDEVLISTDPTATANMDNYLFSDITKLSDTFNAIPVHDDGAGVQLIAPLKNVYDWSWQWSSADKTLFTADGTAAAQTVAVASPIKSGDAAVTAIATITSDTILKPTTFNTTVSGQSDVTVMICSAPWPSGSGANWAPWPLRKADGTAPDAKPNPLPPTANKYNFSFYYCRDNANGAALPILGDSVITDFNQSDLPTPDFLRQYLATYPNDTAHKAEGIGVRVAANPKWLSPTAYYASRGFTGAPQPLTIAGYNAVADGRADYVDAPNWDSASTTIYPDIYIFSYSEGAGPDTQNIFSQIKNNLKFNTNMSGFKLDGATCDKNRAVSCTSDADCTKTNPTDFCSTPRERLARDTARLEDMSTLAQAAVNVKYKTNAYPQLGSGTFLGGYSYSVWPSWSAEFSSELGGGPPADPLNKIGQCTASGYEAATCWNDAQKQFMCPADSYIYGYAPNSVSGFGLVMNMESKESIYYFKICPNSNADPCSGDPLCFMSGSSCIPRINYAKQCNGSVVAAGNGVCGDGVLESDEQCEKGQTKTEGCGPNSFALDTCDASCHWTPGACQKAQCGDGIREGFCASGSLCAKDSDCGSGSCSFTEACDDGKLNGTYDHCNSSCTGYGSRCGDGKLDQNEKCDCGDKASLVASGKAVNFGQCGGMNGQYASGCSLDCQTQGPRCGNSVVDPGEACDGGVDQTTAGCGKDSNGIQMVKERTCNPPGSGAQCQWPVDYGVCHTPVGAGCGDHKMPEGNKQCDLGSGNNVHASCLPDCTKASCGDGYLQTGVEQCDNGAENVSPLDTSKLAQITAACESSTCAYCTNACTVGTVTGGFCGDGNPEEGNKECDRGADNVNLSDKDAVATANADARTAGCSPTNLAACTYCSTQCKKVVAPFCGDGVKQSDESCDKGTQNGVTDANGVEVAGCDSSCECAGDGFYSGTLAGTVSENSNYGGGSPVVAVANQLGYWSSIQNAKPVWAPVVDAGSPDKHEYFKFPFTLNNPATSAKLLMGADNGFYAWIDDASGNKLTAVLSGTDFQQASLADITAKLSGSLTHTLYVEAWNTYNGQGAAQNPAGLWFALVTKPDCGQVASIPVCEASGYTIYSGTSDQITAVTSVPGHNTVPSPLPMAAVPLNDASVGVYSSWNTYKNGNGTGGLPDFIGAIWIWYKAISDTFINSVPIGQGEIVTFARSVTVPGVPKKATINMLVDDAVNVTLNGKAVCLQNSGSYCPTGNCAASQAPNVCDITTYLQNGSNNFQFSVENWNTKGGFVYKATLQTDCGVGQQQAAAPAAPATPATPTGPCGNGVLDPGETCDSGISYPHPGGCESPSVCASNCSECLIY